MRKNLKTSLSAWLSATLVFTAVLGYSQEKKPVLLGTERVKMFENQKSLSESSPYKDYHWQFIGPTNISGRCTDVEAISPRGDQYTIWVGSATGGVWKSVNEGTTFEPVFEDMPTASIGDLAIDPQNKDVVWVGTGEANIFRSSNAGCGVFKTTDGGVSWELMGLENTHTIGRIRVHPKNSDIVYVAATGHEWTPNKDRGLYKTIDGGATWDKILEIDENTGVFDLVLDPSNPETLYATSWERMRLKWNDPRTFEKTRNCGIWKSTDGGKSWKEINNGLPAAKDRGRIGIDISLSNPNVLYALLDNYEIAYEAKEGELDSYNRQKEDVIKGATVYKSTNAGATWQQTSGLTPETKLYMERHSGTYGWVFGQIRVDPKDENTIYTLGIWLNKSTDGGKTFTSIRDPHADHHGLWIDPINPNYIINAQDGGITISYDKGENWKHPIEALPLAQFYNVAFDYNTPFRVFGSIQDHHSFYGTVDISRGKDRVQPVEFEHTLGAEGSTHVIDPRDNNTVYASVFYGNLARAEVDNYPASTKQVLPPNLPDEPVLRGQWVSPIVMSQHNNDIIYFGTQYVMKSVDKGSTWEKISPDLTFNDPDKFGDINHQTIQSLDESPLLHGLLYAGTDDGRIWRTKDGGKKWEEIRNGAVPQRWVSRIVASKYELGTVYMTQTGRRDDDFQVYVWKSTDFGETWKDISGNIPVGPVNVIREDPFNPDILYLGTDASVYISKDKGSSWDVLGDLPFAYVHDLQVHPRDNMLIIATHGRGIFVMDADPINEKEKLTRRRRFEPEP
ncbi:hypothetical protein SLH46_15270 [Draconibacterium sp. IB214405]|uniref:WD40/YVTN/BNR-like repeat-containing protein n=1 Tax=Draconibacterium sp. IB214405 TaxID=3097352 RepID=UPI002A0AFEAE|nr:hypothetical protein [Draconibacterium sp. IB214405]MDX8340559.1 hypothetical protein [Draconibacterium sp. IB214405]